MSRFDYVKYDDEAAYQQTLFKKQIEKLEAGIEAFAPGRAKSLAITALEECYMWIGKMILDNQISRTGSAPLQEERKNG